MKKFNSILLIVFCFAAITLFVKQASAMETSEFTREDVISVVNNIRKEKSIAADLKNEDSSYHGHLGDYRFISHDIVKDRGKNILILDIEYRNTTDRSTSPVLSFLLDTDITQNINGKTVRLDKADSLPEDFNTSLLKPSSRKIIPGEKAEIIIPVVLESDSGTVSVSDLMNNGKTFSQLINL